MTKPKSLQPVAALREIRRIIVAYENNTTREHAVRFCEKLGAQYRSKVELEINWWSFALLKEPPTAGQAAQGAACAEMVVLAMGGAGDLPPETKRWLESWVSNRCRREGALVGLVQREPGAGDIPSLKEVYLRNIAHRAGMDYLLDVAPTIARAMPDSLDSYTHRAAQVTSVLDDILRRHPPVPPPL